MDIQIGWQVPGQQDGRLADTHVYVYTCLIANMLTYLSYRDHHVYSIVGIMSAGRHVDMYTLIYINGYLPSCRPAERAYHV